MKKMLALAALLAFSSHTMAAEGGYKTGEAPQPPQQKDAGKKGTEDTAESTVASLADQRLNAWVTLEGFLIKKTGAETFDFRDDSGTIRVTVPQSAWKGKEYSAKDLVRLSGYVKGQGKSRHVQAQQIKAP